MGVIDEHWCSDCGRPLDKKKDKYMEVDFIHDKKKGKHNRAFLCMKCLNKHPEIKKKFGKLRIRGNPNFVATIECKHYDKCPTYEYRNEKVRCKHIAVIDDEVYCKRRHPGATKLFQEKAMIQQKKTEMIQEALSKLLKGLEANPQTRGIIEMFATQGIDVGVALTPPPHPEVVIGEIDEKVEKKLEVEERP